MKKIIFWTCLGLFPVFAFFSQPFALANPSLSAELTKLPPESVVRLPARGQVYIVNDLHASWSDYEAFKKNTRFFKRVEKGEDLYLVVNGDIVDYKPGHSEPEGDTRILDDLITQKAALDASGKRDRLVLLMGNHEHQVLALYETFVLKKDLVLPRPGKDGILPYAEFIQRLEREKKQWAGWDQAKKRSSLTGFVSQFNFINRIKKRHYDFIRAFKLMVLCDNGLAIMHGAFPEPGSSNPVYDILWGRSGKGDRFLALADKELIINGHSFPSHFGSRYEGAYDPEKKLGVVDHDRVILAPSLHGGGGGTFLLLDLSKVYRTDKDLLSGKEVIPLK